MGRKRGERSGGGGGGKGGSSTILCLLCLVVMVGCFVYLFARYQRRKFLQPTPENEKDMNIGGRRYRELESEPIDIVYTWVNGSDPRHARSVLETKIRIGLQEVNEKNETVDAATSNRFQDNNELRYSLRSIEKFAGWVRNIYLVTNGQVPNWLNLDHPRIQVVSHEEIFPNKSHLPTFSSPAIEVHLHRIPGLSEKWIYFNDDVVLGNDIWPSDFYSEATGQTLYLSWEIPNCAPGCLQNWIGDSYCDRACDSPECDYDGGDCLGDNPNSVRGYDYEYDYEYEDTSMYREEYYYGQGEEVVGPSSCVYGCSDFYLGDHYCDSVCNCPECGYDGGDCGMELVFANLDGIVLSSPSSPDIFEIPNGALAFYVNFSELIGSESKIKEGSFDNKAMVRSAAISSRYKSLVVTLIEFTSPKEEEKEEEEEKGEIEERELEEGELEEGEIVEEEKEGDEVDWMDEENRVAEFVILYEKDDTTYELNFHIRSNAFASSSLPKKTESEQLILLSHGDEIHKGHEHDESKGDREGARELLFFSVEKKKEREEVSGGQISYPIEKETFPINIDQVDQVELEKEEQQLRELLKNQQEQREHQLQQLHLLQQRVRHERERIDSRQPQQRWGKNSQQLPPQQQQPQQRKQTQQVERSFPPTQQGPPSQQGPQQLGLTSQELQQQRYLRQQQRQQRYRSHPMPGSQQGQNLQQEQRGPPQQQQRGSPQQQQQRGSPQQQQQRGSPQQQQQRGPPQQQRGPMPQQQQRGQQDPRQPQPQSLGEQDQHYQRFRGEHLLNEGHQPISDPRQKHLPPPSQQQQQQQQQRQQQDQGTRNSPQRYPEQRYYQQQQSQQQQSKQQQQQSQQQQQRKEEIGEEESKKRRTGRKLNDIYGTSLKFVNSLFDKTFGKAKDIRKVPAHMPHFVQTRVMEDLQSMFPTQYEETSSHPFRQGNDIQMMFAYKYFIVHRWEDFELYDALRTIDTNQDGILNANELRTLGIFCFGSPLQDSNFEEMIIAIGVAKGTIHIDEEGNTDKSWQKYYNHYDQDLEKVANALWVTFRDIAITEELPDLLEDFFQKKPKYKSRIEGTDDVAFLMISEQDTEIVGKLDGIRRDRQKFLCLNDDMNHSDPKSDVTKKALTDLYDAILPLPSAFELPDGVQNPSLYMDELKAIREGREENLFQTFIVMGIFVVAFGILIFLLFPKTSNRVLFSAKALKV